MSTPLSGEELVKRGLFSALIGIKSGKSSKAQPTQPVSNPWQDFDESQPCSTWQLQRKLEKTFLASPAEQLNVATSPNDIFQEIVCECAPMEQTFHSPDPWFMPQDNFNANNNSEPTLQDPLVCPNCFHSVNLVPLSTVQHSIQMNKPGEIAENRVSFHQEPKWQIEQLESADFVDRISQVPNNVNNHQVRDSVNVGANISFEELIKAVVSAVKDSGILKAATPTVPNVNESPEETLRRKRQQNNEAAARYRRRQKEAKMTKGEEVEQLTERNHELRIQIDEIRREMNKMRNLIGNKKESQ